ncbi:MAG: Calx-beta domain-containing protein, partial [Steroidobacteraceae bacterium]
NEGTANRIITVRRVGGSVGAASAEAIANGDTATANADYQLPAMPMIASWLDGETQQRTFTITIINDTAVEGSETINLALSNPTGASLGTPSSAVVTIAASDSPPTSAGTLQFTAATFTVAENTTTLGVTVSRAGGTMGAASVSVDLNGGNAILNSDFSVSATPLSWNSGQQGDRTFTITLLNDALVEGAETIDLLLADATGATLGAQSSATVTITDDDQAGPPPPPPPPPTPPAAPSSGGGGGDPGLLLLAALLGGAFLRSRCRLPLQAP